MSPTDIELDVRTVDVLMGYLSQPYVAMGLAILGSIFFLGIAFVIIRKILKNPARIFHAFEKSVLLVRVPKGSDQETQGKQLKDLIGSVETIYRNLGGLDPQKGWKAAFLGRHDHISLEIVADNDGRISFYVVVPKEHQGFLEKQIQAQYPDVMIEEVPDYNIFLPKGFITGTNMTFKRSPIFPIVTFNNAESDPLNALTNSMSKLGMKNAAAVQILIRPSRSSWHEKGRRVASEMQQGKKLKEALRIAYANPVLKAIGEIIWQVFVKKPEELPKEQYKLSPKEEETVKLIEEKASKSGFDVNVRVLVSAANQQEAKGNLSNIVNSFSQYGYADGNSFRSSPPPSTKDLVDHFIYRGFDTKKKIILNTEEMTTLYHLPLPTTETPNMRWLQAVKAAPPAELPEEGLILGKAIYRGEEKMIRLKKKDRRRHLYVIGQTGVGKSVLLRQMMIQDLKAGEGICVMDPHGQLAEDLMPYIPKERLEDVIYFNPADTGRPMGLNMLEYKTDEQKDFVVGEMLAIFYSLFPEMLGPMFEHYMRNAMLALMEDKEAGATLIDIPRMFVDEKFRAKKLEKVKNPIVRSFWEQEYEQSQGGAQSADMLTYVISKIGRIMSNDMMRNIMGQVKSAFDFRDVMDNQKILLINLSKGSIGDINSSFLGMIIISKLQAAAMGRGDIPEDQRKDFYLYIDEFQNFLTESIESILSEARKYRLCLNIAHQYLGQLEKGGKKEIRDAVFGNVGTKVAFRIGVEDAETMAKEFDPVFDQNDVVNVEKYTANIKLLVDNTNLRPFNMKTILPPEGDSRIAAAVKELSRLKFGKDRRIVEEEIRERTRLDKAGKAKSDTSEWDLV